MTLVFNGIRGKFSRNKQVVEIVHAQDHVHDKLGVLSVNVKKFSILSTTSKRYFKRGN